MRDAFPKLWSDSEMHDGVWFLNSSASFLIHYILLLQKSYEICENWFQYVQSFRRNIWQSQIKSPNNNTK